MTAYVLRHDDWVDLWGRRCSSSEAEAEPIVGGYPETSHKINPYLILPFSFELALAVCLAPMTRNMMGADGCMVDEFDSTSPTT